MICILDFFEYAALHAFMDRLHTCFHKCDVDKNGVLDFNGIFVILLF